MEKFREFNIHEMLLEGGNLIEASAGTGKTYAVSNLYLRLILEKKFDPKEILVLTYTEAATKELKDRIRKNIREAYEVSGGGLKRELLSSHIK